jgi:hypothetical protein
MKHGSTCRAGEKGSEVRRPSEAKERIAMRGWNEPGDYSIGPLVTAVRRRTCAGETVARRVRPNPSIAWKRTRFPASAHPVQRGSTCGGLSSNVPAEQRRTPRATHPAAWRFPFEGWLRGSIATTQSGRGCLPMPFAETATADQRVSRDSSRGVLELIL